MKIFGIIFLFLLSVTSTKAQETIATDINIDAANETTNASSSQPSPVTVTPSSSTIVNPTTLTKITSESSTQPSTVLHKWLVEDGNKTCIIMTMNATFSIKYNKTGNKVGTGKINVPQTATVDQSRSTCGLNNRTQVIRLVFNTSSLMMIFTKSNTNISVTEIQLNYTMDNSTFPNAIEIGKNSSVLVKGWFFAVDLDKHYRCKIAADINFNANVTMEVSNVEIEAFRTDNSTDFKNTVWECAADDKVSDIVPIAVGCALAGLVIIVLIAYLVGRRRSRKKEYQSM
ncbi:lysosome-associated membrane glycoprotein 1-like [Limulus polyphemus]|uniref:Lysosome-associated membrane glycoprotein 5 n=1 Tax=Limulus polyphemus TaxID=6850 RepID=A0ABM1AZI4_LIMPO|nr:lysosome-associated membrane glycoprotein 1-like [Limulus polyphemus]